MIRVKHRPAFSCDLASAFLGDGGEVELALRQCRIRTELADALAGNLNRRG
jgi:hypothetical protein